MFLYKTQSSAKWRTDDLIFSGRSLIKMRNRTGPKTDTGQKPTSARFSRREAKVIQPIIGPSP